MYVAPNTVSGRVVNTRSAAGLGGAPCGTGVSPALAGETPMLAGETPMLAGETPMLAGETPALPFVASCLRASVPSM
jgi:hypothetical protein